MMRKTFASKILLFGEYTIIKNSDALAIPFDLFDGELVFSPDENKTIDIELQAFSRYLKDIDFENLGISFDLDSFKFDVSQGLKFKSSIPHGYGVGSSGALCAAIFARYASAPHKVLSNIRSMKKVFSTMEHHFHGESSGIDPLISYFSSPVFISQETGPELINIPSPQNNKTEIFLLNTARARRTEPLVNLFVEKCKSEIFMNMLEGELIPANDKCIKSFLNGDLDEVEEHFYEISRLQFYYFKEMIPQLLRKTWEDGLQSKNYSLKLCGAGGGGFLLGITKNLDHARRELEGFDIRPIRF